MNDETNVKIALILATIFFVVCEFLIFVTGYGPVPNDPNHFIGPILTFKDFAISNLSVFLVSIFILMVLALTDWKSILKIIFWATIAVLCISLILLIKYALWILFKYVRGV